MVSFSKLRGAGDCQAMTSTTEHTENELLAILSARILKDNQTVFAGIGIPLLAASLAQRLHCPGLVILFEGGVIGASIVPGMLPPSTNDQRGARRSNMVLGSSEVLLLLQRGYVDIGFMGGAQIDRYGNLNSSHIRGNSERPDVRLPGSGGGNDIASLTNLIVTMKHEKRRFVEQVDFVTSPGWLNGGDSRAKRGLPWGGTLCVVTELAVFEFDGDSRELKVSALNPGVSCETLQENTGFELAFENDLKVNPPPSEAELRTLRALDPDGVLTS